MVEKTQNSFAGGILSPSLFGRNDIARSDNSVEDLENFFVQAYGGVVKRGGGMYLANTKDDQVARLIPFSFNDEQTYILEFTNLLMRVYSLSFILGSPFELVTPYVEADLFALNYTQSADVMTIVHPSYDPREIVRLGDTNWTITAITFLPSVGSPTTNTLTPSAVGTYSYTYAVSAIDSETAEEGLPYEATISNATMLNGTAATYVDLNWDDVAGASRYNIYRRDNKGSIFGYVGSSDSSKFRDYVLNPDYFTGPQIEFTGLTGENNRPSAVTYFQQRLCFGGTNNNPQKIWMSQTGNFNNFNESFPVRASDSISFTLNASEANYIRHLESVRGGLLCLTSGAEWLITGGGGIGTPITPASIYADVQGKRGCSTAKPISIGNSTIYVQSRGSTARDLGYRLESDGYSGDDLSIFANHLFKRKEIVQWDYAEIEDSIVWAVRNDGVLLSFTYVKDQAVWAWAEHSTQGYYESVAVVSEGNIDAVYVVVRRDLGGATYRFVEVFQSSFPADIRDAFFVDGGLSYDNPYDITDISRANPAVVTSTGHPFLDGQIVTIRDVLGMTEVNRLYFQVANKTANTFELTGQYNGANVDSSAYAVYLSGGTVRKCVTTISGLTQFPDGTEVVILADGNMVADKTVESGSVTIPNPSGQVHIGLAYTGKLKTLPFSFLSMGTVKGKPKELARIVIQLLRSRGLKVGPTYDTVRPMKERSQEGWNEEIELQTGEPTINIDNKWRKDGNLCISCPDPLPAHILSITSDPDIGD